MTIDNLFTITLDIGIDDTKDPNYNKTQYDAFKQQIISNVRNAVWDAVYEMRADGEGPRFVNADIRDIILSQKNR